MFSSNNIRLESDPIVIEKCLIDATIGIAVHTDYWTEILKTVDAVPIAKSAMDIDPNAGKSFQNCKKTYMSQQINNRGHVVRHRV